MVIVTVHYNTPELTCALISSIRKQMGNEPEIIVFDNSDKKPLDILPQNFHKVMRIDNTKGQVFDFDEELDKWPDKTEKPHEWGSAKHCMSIDWLVRNLKEGFVLLDADTLVKRDLSELECYDYPAVSDFEVLPQKQRCVERLLPYCQWLNAPMLNELGIRYYNGEWMWRLQQKLPNKWYDTGAYLYKALRENGLKYKRIRHEDYVEHLWHGSFHKDSKPEQEFLTKYEKLWK